jgi:hypothetical protein
VRKVVEDRPETKKAKAMLKAAKIPEGVTKESVIDSKNPSGVLSSVADARHAVLSQENVPGLRLPKLAPLKESQLPVLLEKDKMVDNVPFSFQALKYKLGA